MPSTIRTGENDLSTAEISNAWALSPIVRAYEPSTGTIHRITLLETCSARYVLRAYRYKDRSRIVSEHALSSYVRSQGLPAIAPLPLPSRGETILERGGQFYALYPFAHGLQVRRSQLTSHELIAAMGRCLGTLHRILAHYPHQHVRRQSFAVDPSATLSKIERIEAAIAEKVSQNTLDQCVLEHLSQRRNWLNTAPPVDLKLLSSLEHQVLHGDYQETNLFFTEGTVSGIIDWDQAHMAPRAWEVLRTLHYVFYLDTPRCKMFLDAYRDAFPLPQNELALTAQAYGWIQANNLWAYTAFYLENNERVHHLLQKGPFIPFEETWANMHLQ